MITHFFDIEAKTRDYINCSLLWLFKPRVVSLGFSSLTTIGQAASGIKNTECSPSTSTGPLKWICSSNSSEIHVNDLVMYISVSELDRSQVFDKLCSCENAFYSAKNEFESVRSSYIGIIQTFLFCDWADKLKSISRGLILSKTPTFTLNWAITKFYRMDSYDLVIILSCCSGSFEYY